MAEHLGVEDRVHVRIGTLSKALGCVGGFVAGSRSLIEWLVNRARPYVFSTAAPAATAAAAIAALDIVRNEPQRREGLLARAQRLREELAASRLEHRRVGQPDHSDHRRRSRAGGESIAATARSRPVRPGDPPADGARGRSLSADQPDRRPYRGDDFGIVGGPVAGTLRVPSACLYGTIPIAWEKWYPKSYVEVGFSGGQMADTTTKGAKNMTKVEELEKAVTSLAGRGVFAVQAVVSRPRLGEMGSGNRSRRRPAGSWTFCSRKRPRRRRTIN